MYNGVLTKYKILIVDDESSILKVFKQALGKHFHVDTAESGETGLDMVHKQGPYGVVISDLRMPGMDGMQFISQAKRAAPESEFIIQTGYAERETVTKAVTELAVFRILVKPCDTKTLIHEVQEAMKRFEKKVSKEGAENPTLRLVESIVTELKAGKLILPVLPQIVQELQNVIKKPNSTNDDLAMVIEKDAVVSLRLITVAGSYIHRGRRKIRTVKEAIPRLGSKETLNIVMTITNKQFYEIKNHRLKQLREKLWLHSLCCAYGSKAIAQRLDLEDLEKFFLMGLIHDIGKVLILKALDGEAPAVKNIDMQDLINSIQEAHTGLGGVLLRHWRFPKEFISVATLHEDPMAFPHVAKSVLVTHIANILTRKIGYSLFEEDVDLGSLEAAKRLNISEESLEDIGQEIAALMHEVAAAF